MTTDMAHAWPRRSVEVVRADRTKQLAACLATAAALVTVAAFGLSLDTVRYISEEDVQSISRLAWGEQLTGISPDDLTYPSVTWGGPLVVSVLLLTGAALAAVVAARSDRGDRWARASSMSALVAAALLGGVLAVLWAFGAANVAVGHYIDNTSARWGPLMGALGLSVVLATAATVLVRRGTPAVLATVEVAP